jgi:hypothetical protein
MKTKTVGELRGGFGANKKVSTLAFRKLQSSLIETNP